MSGRSITPSALANELARPLSTVAYHVRALLDAGEVVETRPGSFGRPCDKRRWLAEFGETVRTIRVDQGLSQDELADQRGLHRTYISQIERGRANASFSNLLRLAAGLGAPLAELFRDHHV